MSTSDPTDFLSEVVATRYWLQAHDGNLYGPEDMLTLVLWAREARITPEMLIAVDQSDDWRRAESYPELNAIFSSPVAQALQALESLPLPNVPPVVASPLPPALEGAGHHGLPPQPATVSVNSLAVTSLVLGIAGLVVLPLIGPVCAVILGLVARSQIEASRGREGGGNLAMAGIILGVLGLPWDCFMINTLVSIGWP